MSDRLLPETLDVEPMEMNMEILPPEYQTWLDSLPVQRPEPEYFLADFFGVIGTNSTIFEKNPPF